MRISIPLFGSLLILLLCRCTSDTDATLFTLLPAEQTGIHFANNLTNSDSLINLSFEYLFNGGGTAVADFDQDGLQDIFFTGNMVDSRMYKNDGNLRFSDVTSQSTINTEGKWTSGAVVCDVNQDNYPDLYLCMGGLTTDLDKRANQLWINNQDGSFSEAAEAYGLDNSGYSINAAFLDYDQDGDLDMYLLTTELDPYNWTTFKPRRLSGEAPNTDKLYRNNGDATFTDVSTEAGITIEGYGLGIAICDLNKDNKLDLYIANDFLSNDIIYINNGNGTYTDRIDDYLDHTSRNGMGIDMQDYNNDGHTDIVVLDMLPASNARQKSMFGFFNYDKFKLGLERNYQPQYARNTLQKNNGNGTFSEIGQLAGIDRTDWSWCSLFADFDNDGWQDLYITNGYRQDITNMDFATYSRNLNSESIGTQEAKNKKMLEKLKELPEIKVPNYMYKNTGKLPFENVSHTWGLDQSSYSNSAAYTDLDNDGDLDIIVNNIDDAAFVYENTLYNTEENPEHNYIRIALRGKIGNRQSIGARIDITDNNNKLQTRMVSPYRGYLSSVENILHFGVGDATQIETVEIYWPDGTYSKLDNQSVNQTLIYNQEDVEQILPKGADATPAPLMEKHIIAPKYVHSESDFVDFKVQPILPHKHSQLGPGLAVADINGDETDELYIGGSAGHLGTFISSNNDQSTPVSSLPERDAAYHDMGSLLFDADGDGDNDLYIVSGGTNYQKKVAMYQDRLYLNDGLGSFSRSEGLPSITASGSSVSAADYDQDGDLDLFVSGRVVPGQYPSVPQSYLLRNEWANGGSGFTDASDLLPANGKIGMVSQAIWTDTDGDGDQDIMLVGEFMPITSLINDGKKFSKKEVPNSSGWWNSIAAGDFDKDGDMDYVCGNLGLNSRYIASVDEPVCIYAKDYDSNGRIDPVMCHYQEGQNYIAHSRDMLIKQINGMRVRFPSYQKYGETVFEKSFTKDELSDAQVLRAEYFSSAILQNDGAHRFTLSALPTSAQVAPMFGIVVDDITRDGNLDVIMVGNSYSTEIMAGRYDASIGVVLSGEGNCQFTEQDISNTGFSVDGDAKALVSDVSSSATTYTASINRGPLQTHKTNKSNGHKITPSAKETHAIITYQDGQSSKIEFSYGSGYISQSSRAKMVPLDAVSCTIYDYSGKSRKIEF